jgi:general secretion pathway protein D
MQKTPIYRSSRAIAALMSMVAAMPIMSTMVHAQEAELSPMARREMIRRQNAVVEADKLLDEGRLAYEKKDYQQAIDKYVQALQKIPDAPMFADRRQSYNSHLTDASVAQAMVSREKGKFEEAKTLLDGVLEADPFNKLAQGELNRLNDSMRTNHSLTFDHTKNVEEVIKLLALAEGEYDLGKYDDAKNQYEKILRIDPYNKAARRGLERIHVRKSDYYRSAYDETRSRLLMQVDAAWETSVPTDAPEIDVNPRRPIDQTVGVALITEKLRRIIIPRIDFENTTVEEAVAFLRQRAAELDTLELDPARKGVNFVVRRPRAAEGGADAGGAAAPLGGDVLPAAANDPGSLRIPELRVRNVPLQVALKYICDATKLRYKVDDFAVTLVPQTETGEEIFPRNFTVPPDFSAALSNGEGAKPAEADPFAGGAAPATGATLASRPPIKDLLVRSGIIFAEGASATLSGSVLLVSNTPTELDKVEQLVDTITQRQPKQVKITTKFVEITQENSDELGFDWVIGPFSAGADFVGAGGTIGNGGNRTGLDFSGPLMSGVPGGDTSVTNIITAGNRSGDLANSRNSIDAILNNPNRSAQQARVAPGIMSMTGLFSDSQVKMIMRGISQKKGVDLMTAPSVTARSGEQATIEIIREFIYPTEYDPPELQQQGGNPNNNPNNNNNNNNGNANGNQANVNAFPVTPANPTSFETRNTGVTLEIEPTIGENNFMIDLRFVPEIVEFEGFINYGSPIQTAGTDALGNPVQVTITENRIEMPIFATRRVKTALTIYDGYTVAIGGLMREDVQNIEDKVPILGDIPWIGRLFQTKAETRIKSNLIIFVTAQIIDPTGRPLRGVDAADAIPEPGVPAPVPNGDLLPVRN